MHKAENVKNMICMLLDETQKKNKNTLRNYYYLPKSEAAYKKSSLKNLLNLEKLNTLYF
jgi:hypothetical protein